MNIAVPKEVHEGETRVSMIPEHVAKLVKAGADVSIESGLGQTLQIVDDEYTKAGASVTSDRNALIQSAEEFGLDAQAAHKLVMDTAQGSAALAAVSGETMEAMIEHVRSPGGTTSAAFSVFDERDIRDIFAEAFAAARDRSRQLAEDTGQ